MSVDPAITALFAASAVFSGLEPPSLEALLSTGRRRTVKRGETLFLTGDPGDALFAVLSGRVLLSRVTVEGKEVAFASMERGDLFGELALIDGEPRSTDATMVEAGDVFVLERAAFVQFLAGAPTVALALLASVSRRLRVANQLVESVSFGELPARLARLLLALAQRGTEEDDGAILLGAQYTQVELAKRIAASRESTSKELTRWVREGIIEMRDRRIAILDLDAVEALSDDPDDLGI